MTDVVLGIRITADGKAAVAEVRATREQIEQLSKESERANESQRRGAEAVAAATRTATLAVVALGAAVAAKALKVARAGADMQRLHEQTGKSVEQLSRMRFVADQTGVSFDALVRAHQRLPKAIVEAFGANSEAARALKVLQLDPRQLQDTDQAMLLIADGLRRIEDPAAKAAAAQMIFKESGDKLLPFLNQGAAGIQRLNEEGARWAEISGADARAARELEKNIITLRFATDALGKNLASVVVPALNSVIERLLQGSKAAGGFFGALGTMSDEQKWSHDFSQATERLGAAQSNFDRLRGASGWMRQGAGRAQAELEAAQADVARLQAIGPVLLPPPAAAAGGTGAPLNVQLSDLARQAEIDRILAKSAAEREAREKRLLEEHNRGWVASIEAQQRAYEEELLALARIGDERERQDERVRRDLEREAARAERAAREAEERRVEAARRYNDEIGRSLTDALLRGFEAGKSFAENFRDSLVNMFKTMVLRPVIQFILSPVSAGIGAMMGGLGIPGVGNAAGLGGMAAASGGGGLGNFWLGALFGGGAAAAGTYGLSTLATGAGTGAAFGSAFGLGGTAATSVGLSATGAGLGLSATGTGLGLSAGGGAAAVGGSAAGAAAAIPVVGWGIAAAALLYGLSRRKKKPPPAFTGYDLAGTVGPDVSDLALYKTYANGARFLSDANYTPGRAFGNSVGDIYRGVSGIGESLGLDASRLGAVRINARVSDAGAGLADSLDDVADALATQLLPNLMQFARVGESASQTLARVAQAGEQMKGMVAALPGQLGITGLEQFRDTLAVSEFSGTTDRLAAAQSIYGRTIEKARAGDLGAVQAFPGVAQQLLGLGRDTYASGTEFQDLFRQVNRDLADALTRQQDLQVELLADVPLAIREAKDDQIAEFKRQFAQQNDILSAILFEQRRMS